jgi:hypothetical protein
MNKDEMKKEKIRNEKIVKRYTTPNMCCEPNPNFQSPL